MCRSESVLELQDLFELLHGDVQLGYEYLEKYRNKFFARALIRSQFALIEGVAHKMREVALASCDEGEIIYSVEEKEVLADKRAVDDSGKVKDRGKSSFLGILCFTFSRYGKIHGVCDFALQKGDNGWSCLRKALDYRHAITHPKNADQFDLDMTEWDQIVSGLKWCDSQFISLFNRCEETDQIIRSKQSSTFATSGQR
jgi:hypothetical protein